MTQPPNPGTPASGSQAPDNAAPTQPYPAPSQPYPAPSQPYPAAGYPAPVAQPYATTGQPYPAAGQPTNYPAPGYQAPAQTSSSTWREILRMGWWNYVMLRWAPKNSAAKLALEMAMLIAFFLVLAILAKLAQG